MPVLLYKPSDLHTLYAIGRNVPGYLPDGFDVQTHHSYDDAVSSLASCMREWADEIEVTIPDSHDNLTDAEYEECDCPEHSVGAHVGAILTDDGPRDDADWSVTLEWSTGRQAAWWIQSVTDRRDALACSDDYCETCIL